MTQNDVADWLGISFVLSILLSIIFGNVTYLNGYNIVGSVVCITFAVTTLLVFIVMLIRATRRKL